MLFYLTVLALLATLSLGAEVIVLDSKNFEHLTQVSTGATTGDWLVKFYAPWCGHCKKLEPIYEKLAEALDGKVNVAKVDVPTSRDLGSRFEIRGFPTIKFFSKGKVYTYKGKRTVEDMIEFVSGGYQIHDAEEVQKPMGMFGELTRVYRHAYKKASADLTKGNFFTADVFLTFLPLIFVVVLVLILLAPTPAPAPRPRKQRQETTEDSDSAADNSSNENKAADHAKDE